MPMTRGTGPAGLGAAEYEESSLMEKRGVIHGESGLEVDRGDGAEFLDELSRKPQQAHKDGQPELERLA